MANTEILATLRKVRDAKKAVGTSRFDPSISSTGKQLLDSAYNALDEVEDDLILQDIQQYINEIKADGSKLQALAGQIQSTIASLQEIAAKIQMAATAIGTLAEIAAKAASSGLI